MKAKDLIIPGLQAGALALVGYALAVLMFCL